MWNEERADEMIKTCARYGRARVVGIMRRVGAPSSRKVLLLSTVPRTPFPRRLVVDEDNLLLSLSLTLLIRVPILTLHTTIPIAICFD